ncbi:hypothetical protein NF27_DT00610 [Candidatus Jidaibacter acanthamoeba]|uniref:Uncharacterized protein n=1 Tax=Candidatus Jidaibacter acanthamoebae TaxID=86105 RepID=A0A0C1MT52_9RICK|nr:hypothetical protein NF27_DT00610 [Candidatus Jidaibacter acanthamoeba]
MADAPIGIFIHPIKFAWKKITEFLFKRAYIVSNAYYWNYYNSCKKWHSLS